MTIILVVVWILTAVILIGGSIMALIAVWSDGFRSGLFFTPMALIFLLAGVKMIVGPIEYHNKVEAHKETCIGADCTDDIHKEWEGSCGRNRVRPIVIPPMHIK